jgi:predicted lipoprotein
MGTTKTSLLMAATALALTGCSTAEETPVANNAAGNAMNAGENAANATDATMNLANAANASNTSEGNESDPNANPIKP